jgi:hypothetical protein
MRVKVRKLEEDFLLGGEGKGDVGGDGSVAPLVGKGEGRASREGNLPLQEVKGAVWREGSSERGLLVGS